MSPKQSLLDRWSRHVEQFSNALSHWPWVDTVRTLWERFREDRLGLTASSLTFTTLIALVPLVTVMLAVFSAFPNFAGFQLALENYFVQNLVPASIAQPVLKSLTQFAVRAGQLGTAGLAALVLTALALVLTIDRTLNAIWRVRRRRPIAQRVLIYWAALTLGPLLLGISLTLTTYAFTDTTRTTRSLSGPAAFWLGAIEFLLFALGVAALFRYVPNTLVRWRHALIGGVFVALGVQLAKRTLAWYVGTVPVYSSIYGAFAAVPIFLLWIYVLWVVVLLGAVMAAYAPSLSMRMVRTSRAVGGRFALSIAVMRLLADARHGDSRGLPLDALSRELRTDPLVIEPVVDELIGMDWLARLDEGGEARLVMLVDPETTPAAPLVGRTLLAPTQATQSFRARAGLDGMSLADLLA